MSGGVYALPDGRELIADGTDDLGCSLYCPQTCKSYGIAEYRIHPDGGLMSKGVPVRWRIEGLKNTGRQIK
jgi:hypothetical protein